MELLLQIVPPGAEILVHGSPRELKIIGELDDDPSFTVSVEPVGKNCPVKLVVSGALEAAIGTTSLDIWISGSELTAPLPPFL